MTDVALRKREPLELEEELPLADSFPEPEKILNWMSCDINGDTVGNQSLNISSDGTITGVTMEYGREKVESQIFTLTRVPADSVPQKQILTVAQL